MEVSIRHLPVKYSWKSQFNSNKQNSGRISKKCKAISCDANTGGLNNTMEEQGRAAATQP